MVCYFLYSCGLLFLSIVCEVLCRHFGIKIKEALQQFGSSVYVNPQRLLDPVIPIMQLNSVFRPLLLCQTPIFCSFVVSCSIWGNWWHHQGYFFQILESSIQSHKGHKTILTGIVLSFKSTNWVCCLKLLECPLNWTCKNASQYYLKRILNVLISTFS